MAGLAEAALLNLRLPYPKILTAILRNRLASSSPRTILYLYWTALAVYRTEPGGFPRNPSQLTPYTLFEARVSEPWNREMVAAC